MGFDCNKRDLRELLAKKWNYDGRCSPFQASIADRMSKDIENGKTLPQKIIISRGKRI
ncbi:MAG: hypothetical protein LBB48_00255 [Treponema sp.]|jgi:simple sugar transport system substrate-binding protein|nr:hypothetical protein [Treponema sp.]